VDDGDDDDDGGGQVLCGQLILTTEPLVLLMGFVS